MLRKLFSQLLPGDRSAKKTVSEIRTLIEQRSLPAAAAAIEHLHPDTPHQALASDCLRAEIAFHERRDDEARSLYKKVLSHSAGFPDAHYGLSLLYHAGGDFTAAIQHAIFARSANPSDPRFAAQLGLCHISLDNHAQAEDPLTQATRLRPDDKFSWNNLGIVQLAKGAAPDALTCFQRALLLDGQFAQAADNLRQLMSSLKPHESETANPDEAKVQSSAIADFEASDAEPAHEWAPDWSLIQATLKHGDRESAIREAESLAVRHPDDGYLCCRIEQLYQQVGEPDSALAHTMGFHLRHPQDPVGAFALACAWMALERYKDAEPLFRLALKDGFVKGLVFRNLGRCLTKLERHQDALETYKDYARRYPSHVATAYLACANSSACDYDAALECFESLIRSGDMARHQLSIIHANTLMYTGHLDAALDIVRPQLEISPHAPGHRTIRSQVNLLRGEFGQGWDDYEYRYLNSSKHFRTLPFPEWKGESLENKSIVVLAEQGLGDQIMFVQCLRDLQALGPARILVEVIDRVAKTVKRSFPELEIISTQQDKGLAWLKDAGNFDYFIQLGSLPKYFRRNLSDFPGQPYLKPDETRVKFWRSRLEAKGAGPFVGISWRGGTEHTRKPMRTIPPADLDHLLRIEGVQWVSLQYGPVDEEVEALRAMGHPIHYWAESIKDLDEFSALIGALDLVVTVCNTTVHYSGAIGQTTWVLAPKVPEWRYGIDQTQLPWYPATYVFRQEQLGDWPPLLDQIRHRLRDKF